MKVLYIGQYSEGTTSKMRADTLNELLESKVFKVIDTHIPFYKTHLFWRRFGFRYKRGILVYKINKYVNFRLNKTKNVSYDLIWVDKAVFLTNKTTQNLKKRTVRLIHFTPDMAFYENKSILFNKSINVYDYLITTKTFEEGRYLKYIASEKLIKSTQGFSLDNHKPYFNFGEKEKYVAFIGLAEPSRFKIIDGLLKAGIEVRIAGFGWTKFAEKHKNNTSLSYAGEKLINEDYTRFISKAYIAWGALSKRFPEMHTTRTFEIPACGTALLTEYNTEIASFYSPEEVIYYKSIDELVYNVQYFFKHTNELNEITERGLKRVHTGGYDYKNILQSVLKKVI